MPTATKYSAKQLMGMMEWYTVELLQDRLFPDPPVEFVYEFSEFGKTVSSDLVEWFEKLPEQEQAKILERSVSTIVRQFPFAFSEQPAVLTSSS